MIKYMISIVFILSLAPAAFCQEYIYLPKQVENSETDQMRKEGVLVREVTVRKRDTLSGISKKFSGKGYYYPQILLFNDIRNPHMIHPGEVLRVPLPSRSKAVSSHHGKNIKAERKASHDRHNVASAAESLQSSASQAESRSSRTPAPVAAEPVPTELGAEEQLKYSRALAASRKGDCSSSIKMFDDFIRLYPKSPLISEATLNRAECYLKMSGS